MRIAVLCALLLALLAPVSASAGPVVSAFYYPWFGATGDDAHWSQGGHDPPDDIASVYYPMAGLYSSDSASVLRQQMAEIARAGIDQIAVSWWGRGSREDLPLPEVIAAASVLRISVAIHIEPYNGRTVDSVVGDVEALHALGITTFYVYQAFVDPPAEWAPANDRLRAEGATMFGQTALAGQAAAGHFTGLYTYDIVTYGGGKLARLCNQAHGVGLLCAPSVGPGYDARRATGDPHVKPRRHGLTYDSMWHLAIAAGADDITITSFNEWQEGTQIEPAAPPIRRGEYSYGSYDGAWNLWGTAAETAYLDRTAYWANLFREAHTQRAA